MTIFKDLSHQARANPIADECVGFCKFGRKLKSFRARTSGPRTTAQASWEVEMKNVGECAYVICSRTRSPHAYKIYICRLLLKSGI